MKSKPNLDSLTVLGARGTIGECQALDLLRSVENEARKRGWALHRYATNGNARNHGEWRRSYALHPANLPRPRRYSQCEGAKFWVNREGKGPDSEFYRSLVCLLEKIPGYMEHA